MAKFQITETTQSYPIKTVRLGQAGAGNQYTALEVGKAVKLTAESRYELCATGDAIEAVVSTSELALQGPVDGYAIGGIASRGYKYVTFDGLQATPGTGSVTVGSYVLVGTVVPLGTALPGPLKVVQATNQANAMAAPYKARIVSLGAVGTGAAGTTGVIEIL